MTTTHVSRVATLADVMLAIDDLDAPRPRRDDLKSAIRTAARVIGRDLDQIPADPRTIMAWLNAASPLAHGITKRRWDNVRSLLRTALDLVRPMMPGRSKQELLPGWAGLYELIEKRADLIRVSALLRWLSAAGIEPGAVTLDDLERFREELMTDSFRRNPEDVWKQTVWAWNRTIDRVEGWPALAIHRESRKVTYIKPWALFPASLKIDVDGWLDRLAGKDIGADGPAKPVRSSTMKTREYQLRLAASAFVLRGHDPNRLSSLADLVTQEAFVEILKFFYERNDSKSSSNIHALAGMLISVARHWLKRDDDELKKLKAVAKRLAVPDTGLTQKNRERLRPFDDPKICASFIDLPYKIRKDLGRRRLKPKKAALLAQMSVAIALLNITAIRIENLASIEIGRHLIRFGGKCFLVFPADEVKNNIDLEFEIPAPVLELVDWYIEEHRPVLLQGLSDALFPGRNGKPKAKNTLAEQIKQTEFKEIGLKVNAHLFRHVGGKIYLDRNPGEYEVPRRVFGHKRIDTTTRYYAGGETKAASRHFANLILSLRSKQSEEPSPTRRPRKPRGRRAKK